MTNSEICYANENEFQHGIVTEFRLEAGYEMKLRNRTNAHFAEDFLYHAAKKDNAVVWEQKTKS